MNDFHPKDSGTRITNQIAGKTIAKCEINDGFESFLKFTLTDGTILRFRYDWIYEWEVINVTT